MPDTPNTAEPQNPRRRWFQFRLRTLLAVVMLLAPACAYVAHETQIVSERKAMLHSDVVRAWNDVSSGKVSWLRRCLGDEAFHTLFIIDSAPVDVIEKYRIAFPEAEIRTIGNPARPFADEPGP